MTTEQVTGILNNIDNICTLAGVPKISDTFKAFEKNVPAEYRSLVLNDVKETVCNAFKEAVDKQTEEMQKAAADPDIVKKMKEFEDKVEGLPNEAD